MSERHTVLRSMHDLGLAAWFGGSLMGAVGVNSAAARVDDSKQRLGVASAGWARWTPVNAAAIGAHVAGAAGELVTESPRVIAQAGVARMSLVKTGLTIAALAVTGYSRMLGMKLQQAGGTPVEGTTEPSHETPRQVASSQRQLRVLQWAIPALTGALIVVTALAGEQQKPGQVWQGMMRRARGVRRTSGPTAYASKVMRHVPGTMRQASGAMRHVPGAMRQVSKGVGGPMAVRSVVHGLAMLRR
ncbi:hypothetical protein BDK92_6501 [Micromonospora pisi]|uniref:Uncharacterized protein n=1 Tax=Micromonospora pisi TaxID=589240 RepID=A0A495JVA6_9ACTN|nr:hypothetical protein [Micromonospora pisi]RKR92069.1 hypothetical protein BDK92_6501 [Micromonospora pisi]